MALRVNLGSTIPNQWVWVLILGFVIAGLAGMANYVTLTVQQAGIISLIAGVLTIVLKVVEGEPV